MGAGRGAAATQSAVPRAQLCPGEGGAPGTETPLSQAEFLILPRRLPPVPQGPSVVPSVLSVAQAISRGVLFDSSVSLTPHFQSIHGSYLLCLPSRL